MSHSHVSAPDSSAVEVIEVPDLSRESLNPYWDVVGTVTLAAVVRAATRLERTPQDLLPAATVFAVWAWQVRGVDLTIRAMFRPELVEDFARRGMSGYGVRTRSTYRSTLRAMVTTITGAPANASLPRSAPTAPYSTREVAALRSWAHAQGTPQRRRDAMTLLVLGFGAGLTTQEILTTRGCDITTTPDDTTVVTVHGERARSVPVRPRWADELAPLAHASSEAWAFRSGRTTVREPQVTDFLHRGHQTNLDVRPSRMRTTWLIEHLQLQTPTDELLRISGLSRLASLDRLWGFIPGR